MILQVLQINTFLNIMCVCFMSVVSGIFFHWDIKLKGRTKLLFLTFHKQILTAFFLTVFVNELCIHPWLAPSHFPLDYLMCEFQ